MRFTAPSQLQTWAHASRIQSDEDTYDLERTVVGSVVAGITADRCGQCGACDRSMVPLELGNREASNMEMTEQNKDAPTQTVSGPFHCEGCWKKRTHHECALVRIKALEIKVEAREKRVAELEDALAGERWKREDAEAEIKTSPKDSARMLWLVRDSGIDQIGEIDLHDEAADALDGGVR